MRRNRGDQMTLEGLAPECALCTHGVFLEGGGYGYFAVCACGWKGSIKPTGHEAAGEWMRHRGEED